MNESLQTNTLLRHARIERGWTQHRLAEEIQADEQTIRSWERGRRTPSLEFRSRLCEALQKTPEELGLSAEPGRIDQVVVIAPPSTLYPVQFDQEDYSLFGRRDENRQRMIRRVHSRWISGVLDHIVCIPLKLQDQPDAVERPWQFKMHEVFSPQLSATETPISHVYDDADGELLILGEPGAGKTTLLLELAHDLIERARLNETQPIPVVFDLSSWAETRQPLTSWMEQELMTKYQIPSKLAATWIENDQILPLLDGLDEVTETHRPACVEMMNTYRSERGLVPMVVCCRFTAYVALPVRIILSKAVVIQPLTAPQIDKYLSRAGKSRAAMRVALQSDRLLQEMASTPLMLSILAQSYQDRALEEVLREGSLSERRRIIFEHYVMHMLQRRGKSRYSTQQTISGVAWLAWQMRKQNQTTFYIERIQPDWLKISAQSHYRHILLRIIFGLNMAIDAGLFGCFRSDSVPTQPGLFYWLGGKGLGDTILGWMAPGLGGGLRGGGSLGIVTFIVDVLIALIASSIGSPSISISFPAIQRGLRSGFLNGLLFGCITALIATVVYGATGGVAYGVYHGVGIGLFIWILMGLMIGMITLARSGHAKNQHPMDQQKRRRLLRIPLRDVIDRCVNFWVIGTCAACGITITYALQAGGFDHAAVTYGIIDGLSLGIIFGLGPGTKLLSELGTHIRPVETVAWSWKQVFQDLTTTMTKGLFIGLAIMMPTVVALGWVSGFFYGVAYGIRFGLVYGSIVGIVSAIAVILTGMLNSGWSSEILTNDQHIRPNEGIHHSFRHAFFAAGLGLVGGSVSGLVCGLSFWLAGIPGWATVLLGFMLVYTVIFAFRLWVAYGGKAGIEHYVLRWSLWRAGRMPLNYVRFLDDVAERSLLLKIGGGYIFAHRLLLDYFADIQQKKERE